MWNNLFCHDFYWKIKTLFYWNSSEILCLHCATEELTRWTMFVFGQKVVLTVLSIQLLNNDCLHFTLKIWVDYNVSLSIDSIISRCIIASDNTVLRCCSKQQKHSNDHSMITSVLIIIFNWIVIISVMQYKVMLNIKQKTIVTVNS